MLYTKVNIIEKKVPDSTALIHINQQSTDKQNLEKKISHPHEKMLCAGGLVTTTVLNKKPNKFGNKISTKLLIMINLLLLKNVIR